MVSVQGPGPEVGFCPLKLQTAQDFSQRKTAKNYDSGLAWSAKCLLQIDIINIVGVNPRGFKALKVWQTDVTQIAEFGRFKYVYMSVEAFSFVMWASADMGGKSRDVIAHWRQAFAVLGIPSTVKTDNGPAHILQEILGYAGHLQGVFVLTCNCKGRIGPTVYLQTMTRPNVIKWMNLRVMTQMQKMPCHELQPGSSEQGPHIPYNKPHLLKPNFRDLSSTFIYTVLESSAAGGSNFYTEVLKQMMYRLSMTQLPQLEMDSNTGLVYNSLVQSFTFASEVKSSLWDEPIGVQLLAQM
ncbi:hypothetical protein DUI87_24400 [Hirundo rustica rustica]|uniref:Integrase catalytic domain-containing protein n=1 Tax=Hirundo rustica rustica TaxID=333673 RepID=A0A3M0JVA1_HIRRU|nr:hypothetical protein DUI87_24400 [Hirundo rustica rustica]